MKIFLTGGSSLFGSSFLNLIPKTAQVLVAQHKAKNIISGPRIQTIKLNDLNNNLLSKIISKYQPNVIIHAAAESNVDYCENHKKESWHVNVVGTENILKASQKSNSHFIYLSTNAIFNGEKNIYDENDLPIPINYYGKTKYEGELLTQRYSSNWTIIRPITMYGWQPKGTRINPVTWVLNSLNAGKSIKVVDDIYLNPLYNEDLGKITWKIIKGKSKGIYHIAGSEILNRYQWALKTAKIFGLNSNLINPVPSSYFSGKIATRPQKTIYSIEKIKREFKYRPKSVTEGLNEMKNAILI